MRITTSAKLSLSLIGIVAVLFVSGPMLFAYGWQLVHGRDVTLNGLTLHLDRGWIVLHNSVVRIPDDIFYRDADVNVIFVTTLPDCPPPQAAAGTLTKLRNVMETSILNHLS